MSRRTLEAVAGCLFLIAFVPLLHDAKLETASPDRWLSEGVRQGVVWVLLGSAVAYLAARWRARS